METAVIGGQVIRTRRRGRKCKRLLECCIEEKENSKEEEIDGNRALMGYYVSGE